MQLQDAGQQESCRQQDASKQLYSIKLLKTQVTKAGVKEDKTTPYSFMVTFIAYRRRLMSFKV